MEKAENYEHFTKPRSQRRNWTCLEREFKTYTPDMLQGYQRSLQEAERLYQTSISIYPSKKLKIKAPVHMYNCGANFTFHANVEKQICLSLIHI